MQDELNVISPELQKLTQDKEGGLKYRERRHSDWDENYSLYRDKVQINRLIQRQSVNLPLMKQTIRTLLKDVDDMPVLFFENLDNDLQAQVFKNEYWKWTVEKNNMEIQDIVDKRQVFLYGRSFDQWQIVDGAIKMEIEDVYDMLVSTYTDPTDLNTSRFLIHTNIFRPLATVKRNGNYEKEALTRLEEFYATQAGVIKKDENFGILSAKNQRLSDLGVPDIQDPIIGETYVQLTLNFVYDFREGSTEEELFLKVTADDREILMSKPLEEVIGVTKDHYWQNHYPYNSWADDVERLDFWTDGVADIIRTPNKVVNAWFSQLVENRSLKNLNMNLYDSTAGDGNFTPQTWTPQAWGWYGLPGKPSEVYQPMTVADLSDSLDELNFVISMAEKASGATATQQGTINQRQVTLGEVKLALGEAQERVKGMSKFYTPAWKRRGIIFDKLCEAGADKLDAVKIFKKGRNTGKIHSMEISPKDWMTASGDQVRVWSQDEKDAQDTEALQILDAVNINIPGNPKLIEIRQRKLLEFAKLSPDEINDVMEVEKQKQDMMLAQAPMGGMVNPTMPTMPQANTAQPAPVY